MKLQWLNKEHVTNVRLACKLCFTSSWLWLDVCSTGCCISRLQGSGLSVNKHDGWIYDQTFHHVFLTTAHHLIPAPTIHSKLIIYNPKVKTVGKLLGRLPILLLSSWLIFFISSGPLFLWVLALRNPKKKSKKAPPRYLIIINTTSLQWWY